MLSQNASVSFLWDKALRGGHLKSSGIEFHLKVGETLISSREAASAMTVAQFKQDVPVLVITNRSVATVPAAAPQAKAAVSSPVKQEVLQPPPAPAEATAAPPSGAISTAAKGRISIRCALPDGSSINLDMGAPATTLFQAVVDDVAAQIQRTDFQLSLAYPPSGFSRKTTPARWTPFASRTGRR